MATKRKPPKGWRTWAAYMAHIRDKRKGARKTKTRRTAVASKRTGTRKRHTASAPAKRRRHSSKSTEVARKPRRRHAVARKARGLIGKTFGRSSRGTMSQSIEQGIKGGALSVVGKLLVRNARAHFFKPTWNPFIQVAGEIAIASVAGLALDRFVSPNVGTWVLAGGVQSPIEDFLRWKGYKIIGADKLGDAWGIPFVSSGGTAVGDYYTPGEIAGVGDYGALDDGGIPQAGMGSYGSGYGLGSYAGFGAQGAYGN